ncbi:tail fiber protein [Danxiaibacter flavus]|uniref:Tail fiber protein n=1 Tax=Danxiaibacter flavus TaxID=3049108 RepID=A0ABV3ZG48_9BACT|nr:tail fiber protein [Chitinophagaceae bacterium DXS]
MDGTVGEIRIFAGNFAPRNWAFCQAQLIAIRQNPALFSILGTYYGGDGTTTFGLPDFRGRAPIGAGQSPGNSLYTIGEVGGETAHTLNLTEMAAHTHASSVTQTGGSATATLNASSTAGTLASPGGNLIAGDGNLTVFAPGNSTPVAMAASAVSLTNVTIPLPTAVDAVAGGNQPHNNMQPYIAMSFIVCTTGTYPARN